MRKYTILEQRNGMGLMCACGEWRDPHYGLEGIMRDAWVRLTPQEERSLVDGNLRAGEWDLFDRDKLPEGLAERADKAYDYADRKMRPWYYADKKDGGSCRQVELTDVNGGHKVL